MKDSNPRLQIFSAPQVEKCRQQMRPPASRPWPEIEGCLTALCAARSGSTLLCRQLETLFEVGQMGEKLNATKLNRRSAQAIVGSRKETWFGFKCAVRGLICAELSGFFDAYLEKTVFLRLVRRDIVAQAVSHARADQTGQWHAHRKPAGNPVYDGTKIATSLRSLVAGVDQMRQYVVSTRRPQTLLIYEDIATNGLAAVRTAGKILGLPARDLQEEGELLRPIEKMGDAINDEWKERFLREVDISTGWIIEDYQAELDERASAQRVEPGQSQPNISTRRRGRTKRKE